MIKTKNKPVTRKDLFAFYKVENEIASPYIVKELSLSAAIQIVEIMLEDNFAKQLQSIP